MQHCYKSLFYHVGLSFWKCPRRKLYAVNWKDLTSSSMSNSCSKIVLSEDSEDDFEERRRKKSRRDDSHTLDLIHNEVMEMNKSSTLYQ